MKKDCYVISIKSYLRTIKQRLMLYSFIRQMAFQLKEAENAADLEKLRALAVTYEDMANKMYEDWCIPRRFCVYGDEADLDGIKEKELLICDEDEDEVEPEDDADSFDPEADGDDEPSFFDAMADLIERSRELADEMETAVEKLNAVFEPFRHYDD